MDSIQYWISDKYIWIPFYIILLFAIIYQYKKKSIIIILMVVGLISVVDQSSQAFKYGVGRYRPCRLESTHQPKPHIVNKHCGGKFSFYSAHASNSFAIAFFLGCLLTPVFRYAKRYLLIWATIVAYSRIYLGVHYPADIFFGALSGLFYGWVFWKLYNYIESKLQPKNSNT